MSMQLHHTLMSQYKHETESGTGSVSYESVANCVTPEIVIYGKCVQNGTPTPDMPVEIVANNNVYEVNKKFDFPIPTLYAVGNVRDEYYPLTGKIIRRCKKVELSHMHSQYSTRMVWVWWSEIMAVGLNTSICSHFQNVSAAWSDYWDGKYGVYSDHASATNKYFRPPNETVDTTEKFNAWLGEQKASGKPVTLVYVLAEPVIEYVDPVQITSVRGTNIIKEKPPLNSELWGDPYVTGTQIDAKYLTHS